MDRDESWVAGLGAVVLAGGSAYLAFLADRHYGAGTRAVFWFVVAGAQYALLKAPVPDSFTPTGEGGALSAMTRAFYLCLSCGAILLLSLFDDVRFTDQLPLDPDSDAEYLYLRMWSIVINKRHLLATLRRAAALQILFHPLLFVLSVMPRMDTMLFYLLEQVNIIVFGAWGAANIESALCEFVRSAFACSAVAALAVVAHRAPVLRSLAVAVAVALAFFNSRVVADPHVLWPTLSDLLRHGFSCHLRQLFSSSSQQQGQQGQGQQQARKRSNNNNNNRNNSDDDIGRTIYPARRFVYDVVLFVVPFVLVFLLDMTGVFGLLMRHVQNLVVALALIVGLVFDYALPRIRHAYPFGCFKAPFLVSTAPPLPHQQQDEQEEEDEQARMMWFENLLVWFRFVETAVLYPVIFVGSMGNTLGTAVDAQNPLPGAVLLSVCMQRALRSTFTDISRNHVFLLFTVFFFSFDGKRYAEYFLLDYFLGSLVMLKLDELEQKLNFAVAYMNPRTLSWGSTFHALAAPLAVPHVGFFLLQAAASSVLSVPVYPVLGSVIFLVSYARPVKFWHALRKTSWNDTASTPLQTTLDVRTVPANPDAIFYYHLCTVVQRTLNRDREAGRLGTVHTGDVFLLSNDTLTALLHIVAVGNGFTSFQLRGLELQGTLCQEQELASVHRSAVSLGQNCCFRRPLFKLPPLLSFRDGAGFCCNTWRVVNSDMRLTSYSIALLPAYSMFNLFSMRRDFVAGYCNALCYHALASPHLARWLASPAVRARIAALAPPASAVEKDPLFCRQIMADYDARHHGITLASFCATYGRWIEYCLAKRVGPSSGESGDDDAAAGTPSGTDSDVSDSSSSSSSSSSVRSVSPTTTTTTTTRVSREKLTTALIGKKQQEQEQEQEEQEETKTTIEVIDEEEVKRFCYLVSVLGRRVFLQNRACALDTGQFLQRLYQLLAGDVRVTHPADEWVLPHVEVLDEVVLGAVRAALRLHQSCVAGDDDIATRAGLHAALRGYRTQLVVAREDAPAWRRAIAAPHPPAQLLSLRKTRDVSGGAQFTVVLLTRLPQSFTLTRLNRECVRGFWAGQQQEVVYLGNTNSERGSIQKLTTVLRNLINQACDPPVGYPVFVSDIATSYSRVWQHAAMPPRLRRLLGYSSCPDLVPSSDHSDADDGAGVPLKPLPSHPRRSSSSTSSSSSASSSSSSSSSLSVDSISQDSVDVDDGDEEEEEEEEDVAVVVDTADSPRTM